jgi:hypothetical protein
VRGSADRSVHCDEMSIERCVPAIAGDRLLRVRWGVISAQKGNPKSILRSLRIPLAEAGGASIPWIGFLADKP